MGMAAARCKVCGRKRHPKGIRHLPSGRYQARYVGPDGKRYAAPRTFETVLDAETWLGETRAAISRETWVSPNDVSKDAGMLFGVYAEQWLTRRRVKGQPIADRTRDGYRDLLDRFILPTFGDRPLAEITRGDVDDWHDATATDLPTTRARAYSLLRSILGTAVEDDLIAGKNPARIRGAGQVDRNHQIRPATLPELEALVQAMPERYRVMILLAAWCALRFGELTELRRRDVVITGTGVDRFGVLRIERAVVLTKVDGHYVHRVKGTKSSAGHRDVHIPPHLLAAVTDHLDRHCAPGTDGLLFPARRGGHLRQSSLARVFDPAREAAGRPDLRFHDLRHTGAVLAAQTGATLAELMARLGHSTAAAALRYQHAGAERDAVIATRLSDRAKEERASDD